MGNYGRAEVALLDGGADGLCYIIRGINYLFVFSPKIATKKRLNHVIIIFFVCVFGVFGVFWLRKMKKKR